MDGNHNWKLPIAIKWAEGGLRWSAGREESEGVRSAQWNSEGKANLMSMRKENEEVIVGTERVVS